MTTRVARAPLQAANRFGADSDNRGVSPLEVHRGPVNPSL